MSAPLRQSELLLLQGDRSENPEIMTVLNKYHLEEPTHGVLRCLDYMLDIGYNVSKCRVRRLLRKRAIHCLYPGPNLSKLGKSEYIRPYLLRNLAITRTNQVWALDITYIPMGKWFMHLTAIIDIYSRFIVGWKLSNSLAGENCIEALREAIRRHGKPDIVNSYLGSQFTCAVWIKEFKESGIQISMDGRRVLRITPT